MRFKIPEYYWPLRLLKGWWRWGAFIGLGELFLSGSLAASPVTLLRIDFENLTNRTAATAFTPGIGGQFLPSATTSYDPHFTNPATSYALTRNTGTTETNFPEVSFVLTRPMHVDEIHFKHWSNHNFPTTTSYTIALQLHRGAGFQPAFATYPVNAANSSMDKFLSLGLTQTLLPGTYIVRWSAQTPSTGSDFVGLDEIRLVATTDTDGDGLVDAVETDTGIFVSTTDTGTDPGKADTDGDGINDGAEITENTNPVKADTDEDGFKDGIEVAAGTNPLHPAQQPVVLSAGWNHSLFLPTAGGAALAWGFNSDGRCGLGHANSPVTSGERITGAGGAILSNLVAVAAGGGHSLVLQANSGVRSLFASGANTSGQLGMAGTAGTNRFSAVSGPFTNPLGIAAGGRHSLVLDADGKVYSFGDNASGQLGQGGTTPVSVTNPTLVTSLANIQAIAAGTDHSLALTDGGQVYAWGRANGGVLGFPGISGIGAPRLLATNVTAGGVTHANGMTNLVQIVAGERHSLFLRGDGKVFASGVNSAGQLGLGSNVVSATWPTEVPIPGGVAIRRIAGGLRGSHALAVDGRVFAWGYNEYGELGLGTATTNSPYAVWTPTEVPALRGARQIASGTFQTFALDESGGLLAAGYNRQGQLGIGSTNSLSLVPAPTTEVGKTNQTITFPAPAGPFYVGGTVNLSAAATSGLPVAFFSSDTNRATVSGNTVTFRAAGTVTITARQPGNSSFNAAAAVSQIVSVENRPAPVLSLPESVSGTVGVPFSYQLVSDDSTASYAAVGLPAGLFLNPVTGEITGTPMSATTTAGAIVAVEASNSSGSGTGTFRLVVGKGGQTLVFSPVPSKTFGDTSFNLSATASSGLPVSYTSSNPGVATVSGNTVTILGAGTTTITASQPGTDDWSPAISIAFPFTVAKATPIVMAPPVASAITYSQTLGDSTLTGGSASVAGSFAFKSPSTVPNAGTAAQEVTFTPSDLANYNTVSAEVSVTVNQATATLTLDGLDEVYDTNPKGVSVSTTPGGLPFAVTYSGLTNLPVASGTYTVVATITDPNYTGSVTDLLVIQKAQSILTWGAITGIEFGTLLSTNQLNAKAGLDAGTFVYAPPVGTRLPAGTNELTVNFTPTDTNVLGVSFTNRLVVFPATATLALTNLNQIYDGSAKTVPAITSPTNLPVLITYNGFTNLPVNAGTYSVVATVTDANYTGSATETLVISKGSQTITFDPLADATYGDPPVALAATASSGLPVSYATTDTGIISISGNVVTILGAEASNGATITATQGGDANWNPAAPAQQSLKIKPQPLAASDFIFSPPPSLVYSGTRKTFDQALISGLIPSKAEYSGRAGTIYASSTNAPVNAGDYTLTVTSLDPNYSGSGSTNFIIAKALLTARVPDKFKTYGQPNPSLMPNLSGWVNGENTSALTTVPTATTIATQTSDVGEYEVVPSGGVAANYSFQYVTSKLTIVAATLDLGAVTWSEPGSLTYDNTAKVHTAVATGVAGWTYSYVGTNTTLYGPKAEAPSEGGDYVVTATAVGNFAGAVNRLFTIARATQTITFSALTNKLTTDGPFNLTATVSSGLPITYTSSDTNVATVSGNIVTILGPGITQISADQPGNRNYQPASTRQQNLTVALPNTPPTLGAIDDQEMGMGLFKEFFLPSISDNETALGSLTVTVASSNEPLFPVGSLVATFRGAAGWILAATPATGQTGEANITVTVTDAAGATAQRSFKLTVFDAYNTWARLTHDLTEFNAAEGADPDGDGLVNLQEYEDGSDPKVAASTIGYLGLLQIYQQKDAGTPGLGSLWQKIGVSNVVAERVVFAKVATNQAASSVVVNLPSGAPLIALTNRIVTGIYQEFEEADGQVLAFLSTNAAELSLTNGSYLFQPLSFTNPLAETNTVTWGSGDYPSQIPKLTLQSWSNNVLRMSNVAVANSITWENWAGSPKDQIRLELRKRGGTGSGGDAKFMLPVSAASQTLAANSLETNSVYEASLVFLQMPSRGVIRGRATQFFISTGPDFPSPGSGTISTFAPTNLTVANLSTLGFTASWSPVPDNTAGYEVEIAPDSNPGFTGPIFKTNVAGTSVTITNLNPSQTSWIYRVRVQGSANYSTNQAVQTGGLFGSSIGMFSTNAPVSSLQIPGKVLTGPLGPFTLAFWMKPSAIPTVAQQVVHQAGSSSGQRTFSLEIIGPDGSGGYKVTAKMKARGHTFISESTAPLQNPSAWNHIALVQDGTSLVVFVNAIPGTPASLGSTSPFSASNAEEIIFGGVPSHEITSGLAQFTGQIDDIRLYRAARNQAELRADLAGPASTGLISSMEAYYPLDESNVSLTIVPDRTGKTGPAQATSPSWSPGRSPGAWDFASGDYVLQNDGDFLLLELGGLTGTTLYDQIFVRNGAATLDGIVNLMFYGSYTGPVTGSWHTFDLIWAQNGIRFGDSYQLNFSQPGYTVDTAVVQKDGGELWQATIRQAVSPSEIAQAAALAKPALGLAQSPGPGGSVEMFYTYTRPTGGSQTKGQFIVGGVRYEIQASTNLVTWTNAGIEPVSAVPVGNGMENGTVRVIGGGPRTFLRLKVSN